MPDKHFAVVDAELSHMAGVADIYNQAVRETFSIWSEATTTAEQRTVWMDGRRRQGFPVLVALDAEVGGSRTVIGYGSFGVFREFPGYARTVEHSVYVAPGAQRRGIGRALLQALIRRAEARDMAVMVGAIDSRNAGSLALHRGLGFDEQGRLIGVGRKFGQSLDLVFMVKAL
jgi:L-amino acid N-acyltransferase